MWSAMAFTARRTVANVKSSAIRPRQPEVPNLMGEAFIAAYCTWVGIVHKDERKKQKDCGPLFRPRAESFFSLRNSAPSAPLYPPCPELRGEPRRVRYLSLLRWTKGTE